MIHKCFYLLFNLCAIFWKDHARYSQSAMTWCDLLTDNVVIWSSNWIATCHSKIDRSLINSVCIRIPSAPVLQSEEEMSKALFSFFPFLGVKTYLCLRRIAERNIFQFRTAEFSELYTHTGWKVFSGHHTYSNALSNFYWPEKSSELGRKDSWGIL